MLRMEPGKGDALAGMLKTLLIVAACVLLWDCTGEDHEPVAATKVLLVYLAGDNNLSGESHEKLEAIRRGYYSRPDTRLLVYHDAKDTAPRLLEIMGDNANNTVELIEQFDEENSASPAVFSRVIRKAKGMYPGAQFNLLVFSHATGWLPAGSYSNPKSGLTTRSILMDGNNEMALADFAASIPDKCFDYIVFEACHMAGIEVAYELRNKAKCIAASSAEIVSPGFTAIYGQHTGELASGDPKIFMQEAFAWFDSQTGYMRSASFSVIDTGTLEGLATFIRDNCDFSKPVAVDNIQHFDRGTARLFCDFGDYYSRLLETEIQKQDLQQLIGQCVIWKAATPYFMQGYNGFAIEKYSGLTAYMQDRYPLLDGSYRELGWYKAIR